MEDAALHPSVECSTMVVIGSVLALDASQFFRFESFIVLLGLQLGGALMVQTVHAVHVVSIICRKNPAQFLYRRSHLRHFKATRKHDVERI